MEQDALNKLEIIWNAIKDDCLCMFIGGSSSVSYIRKNRDIDVVYYVKEGTSNGDIIRRITRNEQLNNTRKSLHNDYDINIFGENYPSFKNNMFMYTYMDTILLFGDEEAMNDTHHDIFEYNEEFKNCCREIYNRDTRIYNKSGKHWKNLYHALIGMYMLQNNSKELTEQQIENVNVIHDCEDQARIHELYQEIGAWLAE